MGFISNKIVLAQFIVISVLIGIGYFYYSHSQLTIHNLTEANTKLEIAVRTNEETIKEQSAAIQRQNTAQTTLQESLNASELARRNLEIRLRRANLEALARANAVDIERRINQETDKIFRDIEQITSKSNTKIDNLPSNVQPPPAPPKSIEVQK